MKYQYYNLPSFAITQEIMDLINKRFQYKSLLSDDQLGPFYEVQRGYETNKISFSKKNGSEIKEDILDGISKLKKQLGSYVNILEDEIFLIIAKKCFDYLEKDSGIMDASENKKVSVFDWLKICHPNINIIPTSYFDNAFARFNVFYLFASKVNGNDSFLEEPTTGIKFVKYPEAFVRFYGI